MSFGTGPNDVGRTSASGVEPVERGVEPVEHETALDPNRHDVQQQPPTREQQGTAPAKNMLPGRERRAFGIERFVMRLVATCGIVGIGVALGAILVSSSVQGWITGLVVSLVSVVLAAILWSSRQL